MAAAAVREHPLPKFLKRKANFIQHFSFFFRCAPIKLGARSVAVVVGVVEMEKSSSSGSCRLNLILIRLEKHAVDTLLSLSLSFSLVLHFSIFSYFFSSTQCFVSHILPIVAVVVVVSLSLTRCCCSVLLHGMACCLHTYIIMKYCQRQSGEREC